MRLTPPEFGHWVAFLSQERVSCERSFTAGVVNPWVFDSAWRHLLTGISWVEARDATKHPTIHRTVLYN